MARLSARVYRMVVAVAIGLLILGASYWYYVLRPAVQIKNALRLMAATQVGQTSADEFQKMAVKYGVRLVRVHSDKFPDTFDLSQRNRVLEYLHLAPPTLVGINADVNGGVVTVVKVDAFIGSYREFANIGIHEFDTRNTGCVDAGGEPLPVCIKPFSSTEVTTVFFVPSTPIAQREHLLSLNWWCLAKIGGCKSSREFFPAAWEHDPPSKHHP